MINEDAVVASEKESSPCGARWMEYGGSVPWRCRVGREGFQAGGRFAGLPAR